MASSNQSPDQTVPDDDEEAAREIQEVQSKYLRCPSPSFSLMSDSRFSMISGSEADSIFMEPIHLSSAIAAKKIINEELPPRGPPTFSYPDSYYEPAEQQMVEDLYERVKELTDERSPYNTPCVLDLQRALLRERAEAPTNAVDEVWPNIYIAEKSVAVNKARLKRMGVTHVLNAAHGTGVYTGATFYSGMGLHYMGIEVDDFSDSDISQHFRPTAEFMDEALLTHKGKILVNSMMGISRSAVLVASYLMIFQNMSVLEALTAIRNKRPISPNEGFLKQLRDFNETLMEERDDDDDTLSQCSVIDAKTRRQIFGESYEDEEFEDEVDEESVAEAKAHSIMMDEEEDGASVMSSIPSLASSAAAEALRNGLIPKAGAGNEDSKPMLVLPQDEDDQDFNQDDDDGLDSIIREWQRRNEKYQNDDWFEAQLNSDAEDEELGAVLTNKKQKSGDLESVTSEDVRSVKEKLKRRMRQRDEVSVASSCTSYSDLWKQRLKEIEEQAAARYRKKEVKEEEEKKEQGAKKLIDDEVESLMSDTTSMYNFCQKNKESMTPLERWRVKRIQFGWNKKDREDGDRSTVLNGEEGEEEASTKRYEDVNLTAYQSWKLRQQRRLGVEDSNEDFVEFSRGEESTKAAKRRQKREEILERSKKNLEESQSLCGWETESCVSGGTIPLSAFWAGVTAPPSIQNNDDNLSMISGRSSNISSVSQARSVKSTQSNVLPIIPPILPVPTVQGPGGEQMVNLASIQNWISNVVTETIKQKTTEMSLPPSRAGSEVSYGSLGAGSVLSGPRMEVDKASMLSGASYLNANRPKADTVISGASGATSRLTGQGSVLGSTLGSSYESSLGTRKKKITTTSVPLFSLFQDEVDLKKLDEINNDIRTEVRETMDKYEKKKILEDNRRSTLYKKKKPKDDDEDEEEVEERKRREEEFLQEAKKKEKPVRSFGQSGCLNLNPALLEKERNTSSIDNWLKSVRPPPRKTEQDLDDLYDDLDASASVLGDPRGDDDDGERYEARYRPRFGDDTSGEYSHDLGRSGREGERRREAIAEEEEDDISSFLAQTRQRVRARALAEAEDDEVLKAWREQQDAKAKKNED
ncbi:unnamed protein product [Knipowitschia caucasica]|uniref:Inactive dual specificity phosphatase 27 n=1 Tax=Knipowitschia caucasica TaxID=637954 RepID=A0AAV2LC49_KNICA